MPKREVWYKYYMQHREDGPAIIKYSENGDIESKIYFLNNEIIFDELQIEIININNKYKEENL